VLQAPHLLLSEVRIFFSQILTLSSFKDDNLVYMKSDFLVRKFEDPHTGTALADFPLFSKGKILDIGGSYNNKYVILQE